TDSTPFYNSILTLDWLLSFSVLMGTAIVTTAAGGVLELVYAELPYGTCYTTFLHANKTEVYSDLYMADLYSLQQIYICAFTGRDVDLSAEVHFSLETGILAENIIMLPKHGTFSFYF
uniref:Uncharacterized protein n=1 Tax=Oreochromis niloticus TaxID=8128 RepID=A0A669DGG0_ORENI